MRRLIANCARLVLPFAVPLVLDACDSPASSAQPVYAGANSPGSSVVQPQVQQDYGYGLSVAGLQNDCEHGDARGCYVLANALSAFDPNVRGSRIDLPSAVGYDIRACNLGWPDGCYGAGEAFSKGNGVNPDPKRAFALFTKSCEASISPDNAMLGFACAKLGVLLLDADFTNNYDDAITLLNKACTYQPATCDARDMYTGTDRLAAGDAPPGAVGFEFGMTSRAVADVCKAKGGVVTDGAKTCKNVRIEAAKETADYVGFDFCGDSLCGIQISLPQSGYMKRYFALRSQLKDVYGTPGRIVFKMPVGCRHDSELGACLAAGKAEFSTYWIWPNKETLVLAILGGDDVGVMIGYKSAAGSHAIKAQGL
jgi:hypothetical protein